MVKQKPSDDEYTYVENRAHNNDQDQEIKASF